MIGSFPNWTDRIRIGLRVASCPWRPILSQIPPGRILDIGCGHGALALRLALRRGTFSVTALDVDRVKLRSAAIAARRLGVDDRISFMAASNPLPDGPFNTIVGIDVLYLLDPSQWRSMLSQALDRLAPGGRIVIKTMSRSPLWKRHWDQTQEFVATQLLRSTAGHAIHDADGATVAMYLASFGLAVSQQRIDRGYPHPHELIIAHRLAVGDQ